MKSPEEKAREFDHPCRETCSGWKQGYERARAEAAELVALLQEWYDDEYDGADLLTRTGEALANYKRGRE
jgi:hypothetical protein